MRKAAPKPCEIAVIRGFGGWGIGADCLTIENKHKSMPFKPGQSGNPGGRPPAFRDIQALARTHTPAAIAALVAALKAPKERVAAAVALLDRGYGKPSQTLDVNHRIPAASAGDDALELIAIAGGGITAISPDDPEEPGGVVH